MAGTFGADHGPGHQRLSWSWPVMASTRLQIRISATGGVTAVAALADAFALRGPGGTAWRAKLCRLDHDGPVDAVAFSPDGTRVATGSHDDNARVFHVGTGAELCRLDHDRPVSAVAFSPDGTRIVTGSGSLRAGQIPVQPRCSRW